MDARARDQEAWWAFMRAIGFGVPASPASRKHLEWLREIVPGEPDAYLAQLQDAMVMAVVEAGVQDELNGIDEVRAIHLRDLHRKAVLDHVKYPDGLVPPPPDVAVAVVDRVLTVVHFWLFLWDDPLGSPQIDLVRNGGFNSEDLAFLKEEFERAGFRLVVHTPQGSPSEWSLVFSWLLDDTSHLAFDTFLTVTAKKIFDHFKDRGKKPPSKLILKLRGSQESVREIEQQHSEESDEAR
jgi:hypothetical protein